MARKRDDRSRAIYDFDPDLKRAIEQISQELGVPPADVMSVFALDMIEAVSKGEINLQELRIPSNHPKYPFRLKLADRLARLKRRLRK